MHGKKTLSTQTTAVPEALFYNTASSCLVYDVDLLFRKRPRPIEIRLLKSVNLGYPDAWALLDINCCMQQNCCTDMIRYQLLRAIKPIRVMSQHTFLRDGQAVMGDVIRPRLMRGSHYCFGTS